MSGGIIIEDPLMRTLVDPDAALEKLWTGAVWWEDGSVTWSDIPSKRMLR